MLLICHVDGTLTPEERGQTGYSDAQLKYRRSESY
jgi:hypothetical protein